MKYFLGLDVSTSIIGWCILDQDEVLVEIGHIPLVKIKSSFKKAHEALNALLDINMRHEIRDVAIEENLQAFRPGFSSARTLMTLARFNGVISFLAEQIFVNEPSYFNVNVARKMVGLKIISKKKGGPPVKEQVLTWAKQQLPQDEAIWPVKILQSGPRKGQSIPAPGCYDRADAYVIALACVKSSV